MIRGAPAWWAEEEIASPVKQKAWELDPRSMAAPRHRHQGCWAFARAPPEVKDKDLAVYPIADVDASYTITARRWEVRRTEGLTRTLRGFGGWRRTPTQLLAERLHERHGALRLQARHRRPQHRRRWLKLGAPRRKRLAVRCAASTKRRPKDWQHKLERTWMEFAARAPISPATPAAAPVARLCNPSAACCTPFDMEGRKKQSATKPV